MKGNLHIAVLSLAAATGVSFQAFVHAADIGTAFTYQGSLEDGGGPVTGTCDFRFQMYDAAAGGNLTGTNPQDKTGVAVNAGVFTVNDLDFGSVAIDGTARWLEISVCCPSTCAPVLLGPRVELEPAPHALALPGFYTREAASAPNIIGGHLENDIETGMAGATISGGGLAGSPNQVTDLWGTVGGGAGNTAGSNDANVNSAEFATVVGGRNNRAEGDYAAIGGGGFNSASGDYSTVSGGNSNAASSNTSTVSGGERNRAINGYATVGGGFENLASGGYSTVGGGGSDGFNPGNTAGGDYSTVGGGISNTASGDRSTVGGGLGNTGSNFAATVGGGNSNVASNNTSTVGGGFVNTASGQQSTVGGGNTNVASGSSSTVPGGLLNRAGGDFSFAAGRRGKVRTPAQVGGGDTDGDQGTFVWADSTNADFTSTGPNQFLIRAAGGVGIGTTSPQVPLQVEGGTTASVGSDNSGYFTIGNPGTANIVMDTNSITARNAAGFADLFFQTGGGGNVGIKRTTASHPIHVGTTAANGNGAHLTASGAWTNGSSRQFKKGFAPIDSRDVLEKLADLPLTQWQYQGEDGVHHIGPVAEDFRAAFGLGHDERYITTIDADGVALAAIQGLHQLVQEKDCEIEELREQKDRAIADLGSEISNLKSEITELKVLMTRLDALQNGGSP